MKKGSFLSILFILAGISMSAVIFYYSFKENNRSKNINKEIEALQQEAEKLRQSNLEMNEKITYFDTPEFEEKVAKERLNLQKGDENVAIIKTNPSSSQVFQSPPEVEIKNISIKIPNYRKWIDYFFKY